ncbi:hypothetical protein LINPERHAP1_LOCUS14653 [Linum perenne]
MDYMFGEVPLGVRSGSPEDPSILWGDAERHRASGIFEAHGHCGMSQSSTCQLLSGTYWRCHLDCRMRVYLIGVVGVRPCRVACPMRVH